MPVTFSTGLIENHPIIVSFPGEAVDETALADELADLFQRRRITGRDEDLLEHLLAVGLLSLDQIRRLLWPEAQTKTAADRLSKLFGWRLLRRARSPWPRYPPAGLSPGPIYGLGAGGWQWLSEQEPDNYPTQLFTAGWVWRQWLTAEIYTRLQPSQTELTWRGRWRGLPLDWAEANPMATLTFTTAPDTAVTVALELAMAEGFDGSKKMNAYQKIAAAGQPLRVALVLPPGEVTEPLTAYLARYREQVPCLLIHWPELLAAPNLLDAPLWQTAASDTVSLREAVYG